MCYCYSVYLQALKSTFSQTTSISNFLLQITSVKLFIKLPSPELHTEPFRFSRCRSKNKMKYKYCSAAFFTRMSFQNLNFYSLRRWRMGRSRWLAGHKFDIFCLLKLAILRQIKAYSVSVEV